MIEDKLDSEGTRPIKNSRLYDKGYNAKLNRDLNNSMKDYHIQYKMHLREIFYIISKRHIFPDKG